MKQASSGSVDSDNNALAEEYMDAWVSYIVKYIETFQSRGIPVDAVTPQNEPLHSDDTAWTMYMDAATQTDLVQKLFSEMKERGLETDVWIYDHNTDRPDFPKEVLNGLTGPRITLAWPLHPVSLQKIFGNRWRNLLTWRVFAK